MDLDLDYLSGMTASGGGGIIGVDTVSKEEFDELSNQIHKLRLISDPEYAQAQRQIDIGKYYQQIIMTDKWYAYAKRYLAIKIDTNHTVKTMGKLGLVPMLRGKFPSMDSLEEFCYTFKFINHEPLTL